MASAGNRHCASCIGTLSFPIWRSARIRSSVCLPLHYSYDCKLAYKVKVKVGHTRLPSVGFRSRPGSWQSACR